ncbi:MAG: zinc ribbon domain-containing protein [Clostridium sp.]|uniref:zinc ribbon domain-containing protein n=1 Tax=Clostridium sp. TaxID=1506 RepID=UPI0025B95881|nr:zinc ribbon domain-containing protein [Clostridium sp.]MCF0147874.1 zinc ribbon domain-containing protein [Clostridium sp.]
MFCKKCGKAIPDESKVCPDCGELIKDNLNIKFKIESLGKVKTISLIGIILGILFILVGLFLTVPSSEINTLYIEEYVGGDAYNIMIEASLRGGKIAGRIIARSVYISIGSLITLVSSFKYFNN